MLAHLVAYFYEVGPTSGEDTLTWTEIRNWQQVTGVELMEFQAQALRAMSQAYIAMRHQASDSDCPDPRKPEDERPARREPEEEETPKARPMGRSRGKK